jgi:hypothetical protein
VTQRLQDFLPFNFYKLKGTNVNLN